MILSISPQGDLDIYLKNLTNDILTIDRTNSFVIDAQGNSTAFYNPNITNTSYAQINTETSANGGVVNLGAASGMLGIGTSLSHANITTTGSIIANSTYVIDQQEVSIGPKGQINLSKTFKLPGIGVPYLNSYCQLKDDVLYRPEQNNDTNRCFTVAISYSTDKGKTYKTFVSEYYTTALYCKYIGPVGKVNPALRDILIQPEVFNNSWNLLYFHTGDCKNSYNTYLPAHTLVDYQ